jgi:hypothetical protein
MLQFNDQYTDTNAQVRAISSGNTEAFAQATATAFHNGGSEAEAYASAISNGIRSHGCGFYQKSFAQVCCPLPYLGSCCSFPD